MLMRTVWNHPTALDRQTTESINILEASQKPGESLNSKTEWVGAKIPAILVSNPKGVSKSKELSAGDTGDMVEMAPDQRLEINLRNGRRGMKILKYVGDDSEIRYLGDRRRKTGAKNVRMSG